jgi:hypothetical protein
MLIFETVEAIELVVVPLRPIRTMLNSREQSTILFHRVIFKKFIFF